MLKDNFYELPVTEIENLITFETLKQILINQNPNKKEEICEVLSNKKQFLNKKLGKFIDELFPAGDIKRYAAESGTIKNKLEFCKEAINVMNDYDELSEEAKTLTQKIYEFIEKEFEGICVGIFTKNIKREYVDCVNDVNYEGYNREEQFIHTELKEPIQVAKVFYGNNKSKIVPIDKVGTWQSPF